MKRWLVQCKDKKCGHKWKTRSLDPQCSKCKTMRDDAVIWIEEVEE